MMVEYTTGLHEVGDGIFTYLQPDGAWGLSNSGLVTARGSALLIDTLFDLAHTRRMLDAVAEVVPPASIGTLVNTHAHGDHSWGNELLPDATIVATERCKEEMGEADPALYATVAKDPEAFGKTGTLFAQAFGRFDFEGITVTLPTETFSGEETVRVGDVELRLEEVGPAHSKGDALVYLPDARVLFSGDIMFVGGHPVTFTGSIFRWVRALERILALDVDVIVPGHGPVSSKDEAAELKAYFEHVIAEARPRYEDGIPPVEAARALPLGPYRNWHRPERVAAIVAVLYREFAGDEKRPSPIETFGAMAELAC